MSSRISSLRTPAINPRVLSIWDGAMKQSGELYKLKRFIHKTNGLVHHGESRKDTDIGSQRLGSAATAGRKD